MKLYETNHQLWERIGLRPEPLMTGSCQGIDGNHSPNCEYDNGNPDPVVAEVRSDVTGKWFAVSSYCLYGFSSDLYEEYERAVAL